MNKSITFNTGRWYTEAGQRVAACLWKDGILFYDVDRDIQGFLTPECVTWNHLTLCERDVMRAYDNQLCPYWAGVHEDDTQTQLATLRELALSNKTPNLT